MNLHFSLINENLRMPTKLSMRFFTSKPLDCCSYNEPALKKKLHNPSSAIVAMVATLNRN